ncbi:MAG: ABC transporter substrate-binding protein [Nitrospinota bacterium]
MVKGLGFVLMVLCFVVAGAPLAGAYKGQVIVALPGEPFTMDPHIRTGHIDQICWRHVYDPLVHLEPGTGKLVPWLAEKWERISPTQVKFWLRKGAKFTDGVPVTSEAVKYSIGRIFDPANKSVVQTAFQTFDRIEVIDDHTFIWHLKKSDNGVFRTLFYRPMIMSPGTKGWSSDKVAMNPVGSGPYIFKAWEKGQQIVFEANPDWWGNRRYPDRPKTVILRRIVESTTRVKSLLTGEVDVIMGVLPQFIPQIKKDPETEVASIPSTRIMMLGFFSRYGGPFADLDVRKAVNYAIDSDAIAKAFLPGMTKPIGQIYHPWSYTGYNPGKEWYPYDLAKAKEHMAKSGYPDGFKATLLSGAGQDPADKQTCEAAVGMLEKIKIQTECRALSWSLYVRTFRNYQSGKSKDPAMYYQGMGGAPGNPTIAMTQTGCEGGFSGACFPDLDEAFAKADNTFDPKEQQAAFEGLTDLMKAKATHKFFFQVDVTYGFRKKGIEFRPRHDELFFSWEVVMK